MRRLFVRCLILTAVAAGPVRAQQAVRFEVPGAHMEVPDSPTLSTPEFTIEFWLRVRELGEAAGAGGEQTVFDKRGDDSGYNFRLAGEQFPVQLFAIVEDFDVRAPIDQNVWTHVAVAQSEDSLKIYRNGILADADTNRYSALSRAPLRIGGLGLSSLAYMLQGDLDEIRVWDYARPADSIRARIHDSLAGMEPGLMGYWDFESQSNGTFPDRSPNGNDAYAWGIVTTIPSDAPVGFVPVPPPAGLRAFGTPTSIELAWVPGGGDVTGYGVHRGDFPGFLADESNRIATISGGDSTFVDANVVAGYDYYYRLRGIDADQHPSAAGVAALGRVLVEVNYLTGVYYYPQFGPADSAGVWEGAYVRELFDPPQPPLLGHYSGRDPTVIAQHLEWMESYGIDFVVPEWWRAGSWRDVTLRDYLLPALEATNVHFALAYPVANFWGDQGLIIDAPVIQQMVTDFEYLADTYFDHPHMLRVDEKPVVFILGSRHMQGEFAAGFSQIRSALRQKGFEVLLIGDEFRWNVTEPDHFQVLDAVSPWVMGTWPYRGQYLGRTEFFADLSQMAGRWTGAAHPRGKYVVPSVTPGTNGRASGGAVVTPRYMLPGPDAMTILEGQIRVLRPFVDPHLKMIMINGWNHWSADRQIEPSVVTVPTTADVSATGDEFTLGFSYEGYGMQYLEIVRDLLAPELRVGFEDPQIDAPGGFALRPNFPNPFGKTTTIEFEIPAFTRVKLGVYDILGRCVSVLADRAFPAGRHSVKMDATGLSSGVYYYELTAGGHRDAHRMVVVRH